MVSTDGVVRMIPNSREGGTMPNHEREKAANGLLFVFYFSADVLVYSFKSAEPLVEIRPRCRLLDNPDPTAAVLQTGGKAGSWLA